MPTAVVHQDIIVYIVAITDLVTPTHHVFLRFREILVTSVPFSGA